MTYDPSTSRVVVFGGYATSTSSGLGDTWQLVGASWSQIASTGPGTRYAGALVYDPREGMLLIGGYRTTTTGEVWRWVGSGWVTSPSMPTARGWHGAVYDSGRQKIVVFGGYGTSTTGNLADTWEY
jgi:hypothetical protein